MSDTTPVTDVSATLAMLLNDPRLRKFLLTHVQAFKFNALPATVTEDGDRYMFDVTVEQRGDGRWAVCHMREVLGRDGVWGWEPQPSSRDAAFLAQYRYTLDEALDLAQEAARHIRINGHGIDTWRG